jgi:putative salt-induced outer membrane protein YdiY
MSLKWQVDKRLDFSSTVYYQADTADFSDFRILFDSSINYKITKKFALITSVEFRYDNQPPLDVENHDLEIMNGLSYSF